MVDVPSQIMVVWEVWVIWVAWLKAVDPIIFFSKVCLGVSKRINYYVVFCLGEKIQIIELRT